MMAAYELYASALDKSHCANLSSSAYSLTQCDLSVGSS